jgi:hypothetical protein
MKRAKEKSQKISSAIFRGKKSAYNFEVFPLEANFNEVSAVYLISKRKTDKHGKAHHSLVCIGNTNSLAKEITQHKKQKLLKQKQANVVCVLFDENEKNRAAIETDLKSNYLKFSYLEPNGVSTPTPKKAKIAAKNGK